MTWIGHVEGVPESRVFLVVQDGRLVGHITLPEARYGVRHAGDGLHVVNEIDPSAVASRTESTGLSDDTYLFYLVCEIVDKRAKNVIRCYRETT